MAHIPCGRGSYWRAYIDGALVSVTEPSDVTRSFCIEICVKTRSRFKSLEGEPNFVARLVFYNNTFWSFFLFENRTFHHKMNESDKSLCHQFLLLFCIRSALQKLYSQESAVDLL